jgi:hypothetical protein
MPIRPPVLIGSVAGAGVVELTDDAPAGSQLLVLSTYQRLDLDPALPQLAHDTQGNPYRRDVNDGFANAFPFRGDVDPSILGGIGVTVHSCHLQHPLSIGDQITVPQASSIAVLRTKGVERAGAFLVFTGTSSYDGTVGGTSPNGDDAGLLHPFGTPTMPQLGLQRGDLLVAVLGLALPVEGAETPAYALNTPGWTEHGSWTGQRPGEPDPDSLYVATRRAGNDSAYDFEVGVGPASGVWNLFVAGYRADPASGGSRLANVHTDHGAYLVADTLSGQVRIKRTRFSSGPPWDFDDVFVGPVGSTAPTLAYHPVRDTVHVGYVDADGAIAEWTSRDSGESWEEVTDVAGLFTEGATPYLIRVDQHGAIVRAAFIEAEPDTGAGDIAVSLQRVGQSGPEDALIISDGDGLPLRWEPQGFSLSPANDAQERWLLTAVLQGETEDSQWVSYDRCRSVTRIT